mgnify:FL=1
MVPGIEILNILLLASSLSAGEAPVAARAQLAGLAAQIGAAEVPVAAASCEGELECLEAAWRAKSSIGEAQTSVSPSDADRRVVGHYVDYWAYLINKALRTSDKAYLDRNRSPLRRLDEALERFPAFRGVVFRGSLFPPGPSLEAGAVFVDPAFVSTSRDFEIAEHYAGAVGFVSVIFTRTGRLLSYDKGTESLSVEKEVLLPRGRTFRVLRSDEKYRGHSVVFLVEL